MLKGVRDRETESDILRLWRSLLLNFNSGNLTVSLSHTRSSPPCRNASDIGHTRTETACPFHLAAVPD